MLMALVLGTAFAVSAQTNQTNHEGFVGYQYLRQNVEIAVPSLHFNENTDSHGFNAGYTYYFDSKRVDKVGVLGVTADLGANFDTNDARLVTVMAGATLKARNSNYVQPYVRALAGLARQDVNRGNLLDINDTSFAWAAGGGLDINFKKLSRYKFRIGADYLQTSLSGQRQNNVRLTTGFVF